MDPRRPASAPSRASTSRCLGTHPLLAGQVLGFIRLFTYCNTSRHDVSPPLGLTRTVVWRGSRAVRWSRALSCVCKKTRRRRPRRRHQPDGRQIELLGKCRATRNPRHPLRAVAFSLRSLPRSSRLMRPFLTAAIIPAVSAYALATTRIPVGLRATYTMCDSGVQTREAADGPVLSVASLPAGMSEAVAAASPQLVERALAYEADIAQMNARLAAFPKQEGTMFGACATAAIP